MESKKQKQLILKGLILLCVAAAIWLTAQNINVHRYIKEAMLIIAFFICVWGLLVLWKVAKIYLEKTFIEPTKKLMKFVGQKIGVITDKIKKIFYIPRGSVSIRGRDQRSFIIRKDDRKKRKSRHSDKLPKYSSLAENRARIRFIYAKYVLEAARKGFKFRSTQTPDEISHSLCKSDEEKKLICLYKTARYDEDSAFVSDDEVREALHLIK